MVCRKSILRHSGMVRGIDDAAYPNPLVIGEAFLSARCGLEAVNLDASNIMLKCDGVDELVALGTFLVFMFFSLVP